MMFFAPKFVFCGSRSAKTILFTSTQPKNYFLSPGAHLRKRHFCKITSHQAQYNTASEVINSRRSADAWGRAVTDAEKIVSCPKFTFGGLGEDEVPSYVKKLVGINRHLRSKNSEIWNVGDWHLVVLLVSKVAGHCLANSAELLDTETGVLHSQIELAEVTEKMRVGNLLHKSIVNFYPGDDSFADKELVHKRNTVTLLGGDFLFANSFAQLSGTHYNPQVAELMSSALRDISEAEFIGERDKQNLPLPSPGFSETDWTLMSALSSANLLAKSCKGALILAGHDEEMQKSGFRLGLHLALARQANLELAPFVADDHQNEPFGLTSAPVIFTLQNDPSLFAEIEKGRDDVKNVNFSKLRTAVLKGPGVAQTRYLQWKNSENAAHELGRFSGDSQAKTGLANIIFSMC